jgi:Predicted transcriptional regulators
MTGEFLREERKNRRWTQQMAAARLGVSQPYLALMESGERRVTAKLAHKVAHLYRLPLSALPLETDWSEAPRCDQREMAAYLAGLGYPGLAYLRPAKKKNPAEVLFTALSCEDLESRLTEALPWVVLEYPDLDWDWLVKAAKVQNLQNRLGFVTSMGRQLAEQRGNQSVASALRQHESTLEKARLVREDTLCHGSLSEAEKRWLREHRPAAARHWNLLTDLSPEHLGYAT